MSNLLQPATNQMAFAKVGIYGFSGSGKTRTSAEIMIGLYHYLLEKKAIKKDTPLALIDTETGTDFLIPLYEKNGVKTVRVKTRSFIDMCNVIKEAEQSCFGLITDSVTHVWRDLVDSYQKKLSKSRKYKGLTFQDWNIIKPEWHKYNDLFVNSKLHIIVCGRAGWDYDYFENENGKKELEKLGTKMKAETEFTFEPSLVIEMEIAKQIKGEIGSKAVRLGHVIKDRNPYNSLDGKSFTNPTFKHFKPFFDNLNIGSEHLGLDTTKDSSDLFDHNGHSEAYAKKKAKEIKLEEIENALSMKFPRDKNSRAKVAKQIFATTSWAAVTQKPFSELEAGYSAMVDLLNDEEALQLCINSDKIES